MKDMAALGRCSVLSVEEQEKITGLLPYYPQLKDSYGQFTAIAGAAKRERDRNASRLLDIVLNELRSGNLLFPCAFVT